MRGALENVFLLHSVWCIIAVNCVSTIDTKLACSCSTSDQVVVSIDDFSKLGDTDSLWIIKNAVDSALSENFHDTPTGVSNSAAMGAGPLLINIPMAGIHNTVSQHTQHPQLHLQHHPGDVKGGLVPSALNMIAGDPGHGVGSDIMYHPHSSGSLIGTPASLPIPDVVSIHHPHTPTSTGTSLDGAPHHTLHPTTASSGIPITDVPDAALLQSMNTPDVISHMLHNYIKHIQAPRATTGASPITSTAPVYPTELPQSHVAHLLAGAVPRHDGQAAFEPHSPTTSGVNEVHIPAPAYLQGQTVPDGSHYLSTQHQTMANPQGLAPTGPEMAGGTDGHQNYASTTPSHLYPSAVQTAQPLASTPTAYTTDNGVPHSSSTATNSLFTIQDRTGAQINGHSTTGTLTAPQSSPQVQMGTLPSISVYEMPVSGYTTDNAGTTSPVQTSTPVVVQPQPQQPSTQTIQQTVQVQRPATGVAAYVVPARSNTLTASGGQDTHNSAIFGSVHQAA